MENNPFSKPRKSSDSADPASNRILTDPSTKSLASSGMISYDYGDAYFDVNVELMLATTTYSILKNIGRYLRINENLGTISSEILIGLSQYIELYVFAVYSYFTSDVKLTDSGVPFPGKYSIYLISMETYFMELF
jgi:hypothetical protein